MPVTMIAVSDSQLDSKIREIVDRLHRALRELAAVRNDIRGFREALERIGTEAQELVLADRHHMTCRERSVEPWPTHDEMREVLRTERRLREEVALLQGDLRGMGIGPELFE